MNVKYLFLSLLMTCSIFFLSSMPDQFLPGDRSLTEKIVFNLAHIPAYGLLTYLWLISFTSTRNKNYSFKIILTVFAGLVLFAISDEIHQAFIPGRSASLMDIGLDLVGILAGLALFRQVRRPRVLR